MRDDRHPCPCPLSSSLCFRSAGNPWSPFPSPDVRLAEEGDRSNVVLTNGATCDLTAFAANDRYDAVRWPSSAVKNRCKENWSTERYYKGRKLIILPFTTTRALGFYAVTKQHVVGNTYVSRIIYEILLIEKRRIKLKIYCSFLKVFGLVDESCKKL